MQRFVELWQKQVCFFLLFCFVFTKGSYDSIVWKLKYGEKASVDVGKPEEESMAFMVGWCSISIHISFREFS